MFGVKPNWSRDCRANKVRIEDVLMIAECIALYSLEFNMPIWFVSLDLKKAFDRVDHAALFDSLRRCGIRDGYVALLQRLYASQYGSANSSREFDISRGVKQGDVLSPMLFNCILDAAMSKWKARIAHHGIFIRCATERLTNSRYADGILLYAK